MMSKKLKPCPFCGSECVEVAGFEGAYWIECRNCGAEGPTPNILWDSKEDAIKAWNRRAKDDD